MRHRSDKRSKKPTQQLTGKPVVRSTIIARPSAVQTKAERMTDRICKHHSVGCEANTEQASEKPVSTAQFAAEQGIDSGALRRFKLFARLYSVPAMEEFCRLRRPNGLPLHWGYVPYLLTVKNAKQRRNLAKQTAANGWSPARLHAEIRAIEQRPPGHGRRVELPSHAVDGLHHVVREGRLWLARSQRLIASMCCSKPGESKPLDDGEVVALDEVAKLLKQVRVECLRLGKSIEAATATHRNQWSGNAGPPR